MRIGGFLKQMENIPLLQLDHIGIRVSNLKIALGFYALFGFEIDRSEILHEYQTCTLQDRRGFRINLIYNAKNERGRNVLIDAEKKYSGITHLAFVVDDMDAIQKQLSELNIAVTEGPMQVSERRICCFVRDPDGTVIELNQLI